MHAWIFTELDDFQEAVRDQFLERRYYIEGTTPPKPTPVPGATCFVTMESICQGASYEQFAFIEVTVTDGHEVYTYRESCGRITAGQSLDDVPGFRQQRLHVEIMLDVFRTWNIPVRDGRVRVVA